MAVIRAISNFAQVVGCMPATSYNPSYATLTNAGGSSVVAGFDFIAPANPFSGTMRLGSVTIRITTATGSPKITAKLYTSVNGLPGALIEAGAESDVLSTSSLATFSGFTTASNLTPGVQYWVLLFCTSGTSVSFPATSSSVLPIGMGLGGPLTAGFGGAAVSSADNGSTWTLTSNRGGMVFGLTDGTNTAYIGVPLTSCGQANAASEKLYTASGTVQEFGVQFTVPAGIYLNVTGAALNTKTVGPGTGSLVYRLYTGVGMSLQRTSYSIPASGMYAGSGAAPVTPLQFASAIVLTPGTVVSITAVNNAADDSSHFHEVNKVAIMDDANLKAILPFAPLKSVKNAGGSWATLDTEFVPFLLFLDSVPFGSPTFPAASKVYAGTDRGDGTVGTLHASNISTAVGSGGNLAAGDLKAGVTVDDVTGTLSGQTILIPIESD